MIRGGKQPWRYLLWLSLILPSTAFALTADEALMLERVRAVAAAPVADFTILGEKVTGRDGGYRYQLAFLGYGLCSIVRGEPGLKTEGRALFNRLVEKMEHPTTRAYWKALGFEGDGATSENVMYRGHLNLMYGLAHDRFGETRFDESFHTLSRALFDEICGARPICCEPDHLFIQCNSVAVLSLFLHDRAFRTTYASAGKRLMDWAHQRMAIEGTALVREDYRPSTGKSSAGRSSCANAWALAFLGPVPGVGADVRAMYRDWRRAFVVPLPLVGAVTGAPAGEVHSLPETLSSSLLGTTFGLLAAREAGDESLHRRLEWTVAQTERLARAVETKLPPLRRAQARTFLTIALFARTFRGWSEVLEVGTES